MSTANLNPNGTVATGSWTVTGAGSAHAALSDASDGSYIDSVTAAGNPILDMGTTALPSLSQARSITPSVRASQAAGATGLVVTLFGSNEYRLWSAEITPTSTITTFTLPSSAGPAVGGAWTQADLDAMTVQLSVGFAADDVRVYEVSLAVLINEAPVVGAVATPSAATTRPTISWTYSDPEGDSKERYEAKVFSAAQYGIGGFDASISPHTYTSGQVLDASALSHVLTADLVNATTYKAYVRVADAGSGGRFGAWVASAAWTVAVDPPAVPTITAAAEPASARVLLTLAGRTNMLSTNQSSLETDATGWTGTSCTIARSTAQASHGTASLALTAGAGPPATMFARTPTGVSGFPVSAGVTYTALLEARAAATGRTVRVEVAWWKADGSASTTATSTASITDTTGGWTAVTLTVAAPSDAAFASLSFVVVSPAVSEVHYCDKLSLAPGSSTTWTLGGRTISATSNASVTIEKSLDGGATWAAARVAVGTGSALAESTIGTSVAGAATAYDYESAPGATVQYRAKASAVLAGATLVSLWSASTSAVMSLTRPWLKDPLDPDANVAPVIVFPTRSSQAERQSVKRPLGRTRPVVLADVVEGEAGVLEIRTFEGADMARLNAIRASQHTLLLHTDWDDPRYIRLGPDRSRELVVSDGVERYRRVSIAWIEVDPPTGTPAPVVDALTGYAGAYGGGF